MILLILFPYSSHPPWRTHSSHLPRYHKMYRYCRPLPPHCHKNHQYCRPQPPHCHRIHNLLKTSWKRIQFQRNLNHQWYRANILNLRMSQSPLLLAPLQQLVRKQLNLPMNFSRSSENGKQNWKLRNWLKHRPPSQVLHQRQFPLPMFLYPLFHPVLLWMLVVVQGMMQSKLSWRFYSNKCSNNRCFSCSNSSNSCSRWLCSLELEWEECLELEWGDLTYPQASIIPWCFLEHSRWWWGRPRFKCLQAIWVNQACRYMPHNSQLDTTHPLTPPCSRPHNSHQPHTTRPY